MKSVKGDTGNVDQRAALSDVVVPPDGACAGRRLLMVRPQGFSLGWRGATSRIIDIASALAGDGWTTTLLAAAPASDESAQERAFAGTMMRTPFSGAYPRWAEGYAASLRVCRALWRVGGMRLYARNHHLGWARQVVPWARQRTDLPRPDLIWAVCGGNMGGIAGGTYLAEELACPLILEFQDPPGGPGQVGLHPSLRADFEACLRRCDAVVTTTQAYADHLVHRYALDPRLVEAIHLTFRTDARAGGAPARGNGLVLLHAGSLGGGRRRNARSLVEGLARAFAREPECAGMVRLRLLGGRQGADEAKQHAVRLKIGSAVDCMAEVPPQAVSEAMDAADALVVIKYADAAHDMQIPGKLFQYLAKGKPVLGIMRRTEAAQILEQSGVGVVVDNDDIDAIAECILHLWRHRGRLGEIYRPDDAYIERFSYETLVRRVRDLVAMVDEARRGKEGSPRAC